jgi:hypothetical protein
MSGKAGSRGYLIQSMITVLNSLADSEWESICIEPNDEAEKVDVKWTYSNKVKVTQIKSSQNQITKGMAEGWCEELKAAKSDATIPTIFELILIGPINYDLSLVKDLEDVQIPTPQPLNINSLIDLSSNALDKFLESNSVTKLPPYAREVVIESLISKYSGLSTNGSELLRSDFLKDIREKILLILPEGISRAAEDLKLQYNSLTRIDEHKFKLKYEACLEALVIVDEYFKVSHYNKHGNILEKINKAENTDFSKELIELTNPIDLSNRARNCHNKLVLSCDLPETVNAFRVCLAICTNQAGTNLFNDIVELRNTIRLELGFGNNFVDTDPEKAWISMVYPKINKEDNPN